MKNVLWAIQSICPPQDAQQLMTACAALGIETCVIENSAVGELPNVATNRPVLFYGSCRFIRKIVTSGRWHPGAYYDDRNFRFSESLRHWGARMLNREAVFLLLGDVCGKGAEAAALTGRTRQSIRTAAYFDRRPAQILAAGGSAADAAIAAGASERTLARRLQGVLGKSPLSYFQDLRVEREPAQEFHHGGAAFRVRSCGDVALRLVQQDVSVALGDLDAAAIDPDVVG